MSEELRLTSEAALRARVTELELRIDAAIGRLESVGRYEPAEELSWEVISLLKGEKLVSDENA